MRRRTWLAGALITLVAIPQHAHSQSEKVRLAGKVVTDAAAPQPIGGVEVLIVDLGNATTSAKNGSFELTKIPSGSHRVRFRRIGYVMRDTTLQFNGADSVVIAMTPITELDSVKVVGRERDFGMEEFERNRKMGFGTFFTRDDIAKFDAMRTGDIFEQTQGVTIARGTGGQVWLQGKGRSASIRGRTIQVNETDLASGATDGCYATVYLDNARVYTQTITEGGGRIAGKIQPNEKANPLFDINSIAPSSIEAIEYYSGAAQIPARYMGLNTQCGVLVIHTRRPDKKPPTW